MGFIEESERRYATGERQRVNEKGNYETVYGENAANPSRSQLERSGKTARLSANVTSPCLIAIGRVLFADNGTDSRVYALTGEIEASYLHFAPNPELRAERIAAAYNAYPHLERLREAALDCAKRMEKLRELLKVSGAPDAQWNILDTKDVRAALAAFSPPTEEGS